MSELPPPDSPRRGSLLVIFLTVFIDLLGFGMVLPLLPIYAKQFAHVDWMPIGPLIGLLMASFSAMQFIFAPIWGRISDRVGRRPVIMIGLAGSVVFYALFGVGASMKSLALLFISRIGAGVAGATISTAHAYIADTTTAENRTRGMAMVGAAFGLGFTFGPLLGYLALPSGVGDPGPGPGYAAAGLSAVALAMAYFMLPESLDPSNVPPRRGFFSTSALADALRTPSVGLLLFTIFACVFSFANFESTLSLLIKDETGAFKFTFREVCLVFAFVGFVLTLVQGGIVRRVAGKVDESVLASGGAIVEIVGFSLLAIARSQTMLLAALAVVVSGFAFMTPSLNAMVSRRSDPAKQGGVMGVAQGASALARILGPMLGVTLFYINASWPLWTAAALMAASLLLISLAARGGKDFAKQPA
jgi:MFS family permease